MEDEAEATLNDWICRWRLVSARLYWDCRDLADVRGLKEAMATADAIILPA